MSCANPCAPQKIASLSRRKSIVSVQKPVAAKPKQPAPIGPAQAKNGANQKGKPQTGAGAKPEQTKQKSESNVDSSKDLSRAIGSNILLVGTLLISGIVIASLTWRLASSPVDELGRASCRERVGQYV